MGQQAIDYNAVPFGRGAFRMYGKPNDYQYYKFFKNRDKDGSYPDRNAWTYCVRQGVLAIQLLLRQEWGFDQELSGLYGRATRRHVREFQLAHDLTAEGVTGPYTAQALMRPVIRTISQEIGVEPKFIHAFASLESGYDPGAQGIDHPTDLGLWQHNVEDTLTTDLEAFDPWMACTLAARRFASSLEKYDGKGDKLQINCAIAQHNWPVGADLWYERGEPPTPEIENYVKLVRSRAGSWK